jgi:hypothetical protein
MGFLTAGLKSAISRLTAGNRIATKGCSYIIYRLTSAGTDIEECTYQAAEKLNILSTSITSVIPEGAQSACGGESRKNNSLLDTGSRLRLVRYDVWGRFQAFSAIC